MLLPLPAQRAPGGCCSRFPSRVHLPRPSPCHAASRCSTSTASTSTVARAGDTAAPSEPTLHEAPEPLGGERAPADQAAAAAAAAAAAPEKPPSYRLVTFYCLADVEDPHAVVASHRAFCAGPPARDIRGRIYVSPHGINAQLSGRGGDAEAYAAFVAGDPRFGGARVSAYDCGAAHAFPRLALRYKPSLVQMGADSDGLAVTSPAARAEALGPEEWHAALSSAARATASGGPAPLVLDVRNGYEWDAGRFEGASRPVTESFRETVLANAAVGGPLAGADPDSPVYMYCTGGIRCDFYSAALRRQGFTRLYTLKGGVQAYLDAFPPAAAPAAEAPVAAAAAAPAAPPPPPPPLWRGHLFVFDSRLAMTSSGAAAGAPGAPGAPPAGAGLACFCCGEPRAAAPHRNCPSVDCNRLFLVCTGCTARHGGFCCAACAAATHVRPPLLVPGQRYTRLSHYLGAGELAGRRGGEGRRLRKARRRERLRGEQRALAVDALAAALDAAQQQQQQQQRGEGEGGKGDLVDWEGARARLGGDSERAAAAVQLGGAGGEGRGAEEGAGTARRRQRAARLAAAVLSPAVARAMDRGRAEAAGGADGAAAAAPSRFAAQREALLRAAQGRLEERRREAGGGGAAALVPAPV